MSEVKHTPGPWRWEVNRSSRLVHLCGGEPRGGFGRYDLNVLTFKRWGMQRAAPVFWSWDGNIGDPKRADELAVAAPDRDHHADWFALIDHPDAHLIQAAPDLLEALERLIEDVERTRSDFWGLPTQVRNSSVAKAQAAISKAKGDV